MDNLIVKVATWWANPANAKRQVEIKSCPFAIQFATERGRTEGYGNGQRTNVPVKKSKTVSKLKGLGDAVRWPKSNLECGAINHSTTSPEATLAGVFRAYCGKVESSFLRPKAPLRRKTPVEASGPSGPSRHTVLGYGGRDSYPALAFHPSGRWLSPNPPRWRLNYPRIETKPHAGRVKAVLTFPAMGVAEG